MLISLQSWLGPNAKAIKALMAPLVVVMILAMMVLPLPPLARALFAHAELDREVPAALFAAVAQVLAYVYQLRAALAGRGAMPGDLPELNVPAELDPHHKDAE